MGRLITYASLWIIRFCLCYPELALMDCPDIAGAATPEKSGRVHKRAAFGRHG